MATATTTRKYEEVSDRAFLAMQIVQRDGKGRDPDDVGPVDVTLRIHGVVARGEPTSQSRKSVDWESLVRILLWAMVGRERDIARLKEKLAALALEVEAKHADLGMLETISAMLLSDCDTLTSIERAQDRIRSKTQRRLTADITDWVEAVTTVQEFPRNGNLVGQVKVELLAENTEASLPQAEDIAREAR